MVLELTGTLVMTTRAESAPTIVGDVPVETVAVNTKGGSLSAIIKRSLRGDFTGGASFYGARMDFEPGISCVLVAPGRTEARDHSGPDRKFRVQRVTPRRYIIDFGDEEKDVTIDPMTKATLQILEEMAKAGKLTLLSPEEADKRFAQIEAGIAEGNKLATALRKAHKHTPR
jgi:hypothetical protein